MMPRTLKDVLLCALLAVLSIGAAGGEIMVGLHLRGWCKGMDNLLAEAQTAAGRANTTIATMDSASRSIATDIRRDVIVAGGAEGETEKTMRAVRGRLPALLDSGKTSIDKLGGVEDAATRRLDAMAPLEAKAEAATDAMTVTVTKLGTTEDAATDTITRLGNASDGLTGLSAALRLQVEDPENGKLRAAATDFLTSYAGLGKTLNTASGHIDARFFAPYSGTHPRLNAGWTYFRGVAGLAAPAYYGIGAAKGQ